MGLSRRLLIALPLASAVLPWEAGAMPPPTRMAADFRSGFLMNLHHFLYAAGRDKAVLEGAPWARKPGASELAVLRDAAAAYKARYAERSLLFDRGMAEIRQALATDDDQRRKADGLSLPDGLAELLDRAGPVYDSCLWPAHDQANQDWIARLRELNQRYGSEVQLRLELAFTRPFPAALRVDVVADTGDRNGAYTSEAPPQAVLPSGRPDYGGMAALEMLYHEASHVHVLDTVSRVIDEEIQAAGRAPDKHLWHAVQFYTVGYVVQDVLRRRAETEYQPYARKNGVFDGPWAAYLPGLEKDWRGYLDKQLPMREAVKALVARLPAR